VAEADMADLEIADRARRDPRDVAKSEPWLALRGLFLAQYRSQATHRRSQLLLDEAAENLIDAVYRDVLPMAVDIYRNYAQPVLKADLLRYLLLYRFGGFYADADVTCVRNITSWLPTEMWENASLHTV
jgi:hypothetical protein